MVKTNDGLPWWVNALYKVGAPIAIACYLVWFLTTKVQTDIENVQAVVIQHVKDLQDQRDAVKDTNRLMERQLRMLEAMCLHNAKSDEQRQECYH